MSKKTKLLVVRDITIPNATAAGSRTQDIQLPAQYEKITGVAIAEKSDGGNAASYDVGFYFPTDSATINSVSKQLYQFDKATPQSERFQDLDLTCKGQTVTVTTRTSAATSAELKYQVIFTVENS